MDILPKRIQNRLKEYDYCMTGYYFVIICVHNRIEKFGTINNYKMILNESGKIVKKTWLEIPAHFNNIDLDQYIIMPNHMHGIIIINNSWKMDKNNINNYGSGMPEDNANNSSQFDLANINSNNQATLINCSNLPITISKLSYFI